MPGSLLHLGQLNLSSGFAFCWLAYSFCGFYMYLQRKHIETGETHIEKQEKVRASLTKDQKKNRVQIWIKFIFDGVAKSIFFFKMNNSLSVKVVKNDKITPEIYKTLPRKFPEKLEENGSFVMVSHLNIPQPHTIVRKTSMSVRLYHMGRKAWRGMTDRFHIRRMESTDSSEIPIKRMKKHNRKGIATGRGRGRAKGQLRRSGVSQTWHRKERTKLIQDEYKTWQQIYSVQNECTVDDTDECTVDDTDGYDVPDAAQFIEKTISPIILNLSDITSTKYKLEARNKQKEAKYSTRVRYVSSTKINNGYRGDSEMYETDSSRSRLLSECTDDSEDSFVIFEDCDDELSEARNEQDTTEYQNKMHCLPNDSWTSNNQMNCDSNKCDMQSPLRERLLSESSIDSEDFCIVFKSQSDYLNDCTIDDCDEMTFRNQDSQLEDNSTIENESINENYQDSVACIAYDDQNQRGINSEKLTAKKKTVSFDLNPAVHIMVKWDYAYRAARKGPWEEMARDNDRFKKRINSIAAVLDPILTNNHRSQVWQKRFAL